MTTYSYRIVVTEQEMKALEEALLAYGKILREKLEKEDMTPSDKHKYQMHCRSINDMWVRLHRDMVMTSRSFGKIPKAPIGFT